MPTEIIKKRFTVENYRRMAETGILRPTDRAELIDGEVVQVSPIGRPHRVRMLRATTLLSKALGDPALVAVKPASNSTSGTNPSRMPSF